MTGFFMFIYKLIQNIKFIKGNDLTMVIHIFK